MSGGRLGWGHAAFATPLLPDTPLAPPPTHPPTGGG